jgi:hypothetical protein
MEIQARTWPRWTPRNRATKTNVRSDAGSDDAFLVADLRVSAVHQLYASDPKYKKYTQQVEKCLNAFDNVHEWADCSAFLKHLLKVLSSTLIWNH